MKTIIPLLLALALLSSCERRPVTLTPGERVVYAEWLKSKGYGLSGGFGGWSHDGTHFSYRDGVVVEATISPEEYQTFTSWARSRHR